MKTINTANRLFATIATGLIGAAASSLAILPAAANSLDVPQVTVKYEDLDVSTLAGSTVLYTRIQHAAQMVCAQFDDRELSAMSRRNACIDAALQVAITRVNNATLNAVYASKTGKPAATRFASLSN